MNNNARAAIVFVTDEDGCIRAYPILTKQGKYSDLVMRAAEIGYQRILESRMNHKDTDYAESTI